MEILALNLQTRDKKDKVKDLRKSNLIPAEFYGKGVENKSLQVDYQTFRRLFRQAGGNTVLELHVDDGKETYNALVHEVSYHPVTDVMTHIEFINVSMNEEIHTHIPLKLVGMAPAVKELAGVLVNNLDQIEVKCLPKDMIHDIEVNIESLVDFTNSIHVGDLNVPSKITVLTPADQLVVSVIAPRVEVEAPVEAAAAPAEGAAAPEAEKKEE